MLRLAGNTPDQMTNALKIEFALHFPVDHLPDKGRLASLFGRRTAA
jgi:hypothetical protein